MMEKKWIMVILAALIILCTCAAIFLQDTRIDTFMDVSSFNPSSASDDGEVLIDLKSNESNNDTEIIKELEEKPVFLNLTDNKNNTKEYNGTTDNWGSYKIWNIKSGNYSYSAWFPGDDEYKPSSANGTLTIKEYVPSNDTTYYIYKNVTSYNISQPKYIVRYVYV